MAHQESFFGLGFSSRHPNSEANHTHDDTILPSSSSPSKTESAVNSMEAIMQSYMQQCIMYHEQQFQGENYDTSQSQKPTKSGVDFPATRQNNYSTSTPPVLFIPSSTGTEIIDCTKTIKNEIIPINTINDEKHELRRIERENQEKIEKAKEIAKKLAAKPIPTSSQSQHNNNHDNIVNSRFHPTTSIAAQHPSEYNYAQKRNEFLTTIHSNKLQSFYLKNLNYLLKKDEEIHSIQIQHLEHQRQQEQKQQQHIQFISIKRKSNNGNRHNNVMSGIGTQERNKLQKSVEKTHHSFMKNSNTTKKRKNQQCCGLYISGIKPLREMEEEQQKMIRSLFENYGVISRSQFYVDKQTGLSKGDALIVYIWENDQDQHHGDDEINNDKVDCRDLEIKSFLNMICSQLNGVELPCGSVLSVEPANMSYKQEFHKSKRKDETTIVGKQSILNNSLPGPGNTTSDTKSINHNSQNADAIASSTKVEDFNDELDDFFASL